MPAPAMPAQRMRRERRPRRSARLRRGAAARSATRRAALEASRAALAPEQLADLSPTRSTKGTGREAGATEEQRSRIGVASSSPPFPSSGKGNGGLGSGAAGTADAHALYDQSPPPAYPEIARRENQEGSVLLRVLVEADGSVARVEIAQSSGFDALDRAAVDTVRIRWRFVAAERGGANVASWVLVPIRFALRSA